MNDSNSKRRKFLKGAVYTAPVIASLKAAPSFAKGGSYITRMKCDQGRGNGDDGCSPGHSDHQHGSNDSQKKRRK